MCATELMKEGRRTASIDVELRLGESLLHENQNPASPGPRHPVSASVGIRTPFVALQWGPVLDWRNLQGRSSRSCAQ